MTTTILVAIGGAALVAILGAIVWLRRGGGAPPIAAEAASAAAETALPGFGAKGALIGADRRTALVIGRHERVAIVRAGRRQPRVDEVRWHDVRALEGGLQVETRRGRAFVDGVDVLDVRRLGGAEWKAKN